MLYFLLTKRTRFTIQQFFTGRGKHLAEIMELLYYEDLYLKKELRPGALVFMDMDHMLPETNTAAAKVHEYLDSTPDKFKLLNHPVKSLTRYALLKKLHGLGVNAFQICKASEDLSVLSMPVYLRSALGHNRILSGLLNDQNALRRAIMEMCVLGHHPDKIYVIEFCDTSDEHGIFTKYSALKIGDRILPRHVNFNTHWIVKSSAEIIDHALHMSHRDHIDWYFKTHPHKDWLENVFHIAGIDYGRVDYSILHGKPQLWEINTNPAFGTGQTKHPSHAYQEAEEPYKLLFYEDFITSIKTLAAEPIHAGSIPLQPIHEFILQIHHHLETPEEEVKSPVIFRKAGNSKKWWVVIAWNVLLKLYSVFFHVR